VHDATASACIVANATCLPLRVFRALMRARRTTHVNDRERRLGISTISAAPAAWDKNA
jgi:hypothetical protein